MKIKRRFTRNDLFVYAVTGAVLFDLLQLILYGIYWFLPGSAGGENNLRGAIFMVELILSVPAALIAAGLGMHQVHHIWTAIIFRVLADGLVGAILFTTVMVVGKGIQGGSYEAKL